MDALQRSQSTFVRRWGELGGYWGINRTMAEIHALLLIAARPLCTDDVMRELQISRGNASMNLRSLVDWELIQRVHLPGDRKEYFEAETNIWQMFETIMRERRRREVEPIVATIQRCRELLSATQDVPASQRAGMLAQRQRFDDLQRFLHAMGKLFELVLQVGPAGIESLAELLETGPTHVEPKAQRRGKPRKRRDEPVSNGKA